MSRCPAVTLWDEPPNNPRGRCGLEAGHTGGHSLHVGPWFDSPDAERIFDLEAESLALFARITTADGLLEELPTDGAASPARVRQVRAALAGEAAGFADLDQFKRAMNEERRRLSEAIGLLRPFEGMAAKSLTRATAGSYAVIALASAAGAAVIARCWSRSMFLARAAHAWESMRVDLAREVVAAKGGGR